MEKNKLNMKTNDITEQNIENIKKLFPNVITEKEENGKIVKAIDFELLKQVLSKDLVETNEERYTLNWPGKKASILKANTPITKTLRPIVEDSVDFENTENLYIKGDNFEVLKILQESYLNKVKMIYIDPPYNTGKDFIYNDNFKQDKEEYNKDIGAIDEDGYKMFTPIPNTDSNGRYHSDWLSMMYERLTVARDLLTDDGVIFMSIDANEVHNLRKISDEIFGEENFVTEIAIEITKTQGMKVRAAKQGSIVKNYEYIICYKKNGDNKLVKNLLYDINKGYDTHFSHYIEFKNDKFEISRLTDVLKNNKEIYNEFKKFELLKDEKISLNSIEKILNNSNLIKNYLYKEISSNIYQEMACDISIPLEIKEMLNKSKIVKYKNYLLTKSSGGKYRQFSSLKETLNYSDEYSGEFGRVTIRGNLWKGFYSDMMNVAKEGDTEFKNGKKPIRLIKQLLKWVTNKNDLILDFFSGSATTAHAVMQLNAEDGGNRKFIMVQLPEKTAEKSEAFKAGYKTIAEIGKERIRRAGKKIKSDFIEKYDKEMVQLGKNKKMLIQDKGMEKNIKNLEEKIEKIKNLDTGFRVYKVDETNMKDVYYHPSELDQSKLKFTESNIKEDRTSEDLLTQVILDLGLKLSLPIEKRKIKENEVFFVRKNSLVACFDKDMDFSIIDEIAKIKPLKVVFRDASFKNDADLINLETKFKELSPDTMITVL